MPFQIEQVMYHAVQAEHPISKPRWMMTEPVRFADFADWHRIEGDLDAVPTGRDA